MAKFDVLKDVHKFEIEGNKMLLDVNSGSLYEIDEMIWDYLDALIQTESDFERAWKKMVPKYKLAEIEELKQEVVKLQEEGVFLSTDTFGDTYRPEEKPLLKSLCLNVAHACNLRCGYCFAAKGNFGGKPMLMSAEIGKKAIDYLIEHSGDRKYSEIDFFGGEPTLNMENVKEIYEYGKEAFAKTGKHIKFTITTNAVTLDEDLQNYLNETDISVVLSHDGRPEVHDKFRVFADGKGTQEIVNNNVKSFLKLRNDHNYYVRGTYTKFNKDFSEDARYLADQGYEIISLEPAVVDESLEYALSEEDLPVLREEYFKLAKLNWQRKKEGRPFSFFHFNIDLENGPCLPKRMIGCGAGYSYMAVTPEGDLYPCHQFVGKEEYKLGTLDSEVLDQSIMDKFKNAHIYNKEACKNCWARFHCSGGCHANAYSANGDIYQPYKMGCELEKIRLEYALWLQLKNREKSC